MNKNLNNCHTFFGLVKIPFGGLRAALVKCHVKPFTGIYIAKFNEISV